MASINGTTGTDTITGTSGDDYIDSKGGNDIIDGGAGNDALLIFEDYANFNVSTLSGVTKIYGTGYATGYEYDTITLTNVEQVQFADQTIQINTDVYPVISGTTNTEVLTGTTGDDYFDSKGGSDTIDGGAGNDTLLIFAPSYQFIINTLYGVSQIEGDGYVYSGYYNIDKIIATNVEQLQFIDKTIQLNTDNYTITSGTSDSDTLNGTSGDDYFDSKGGNDVIDGGAGDDTLIFFEDSSKFTISTLAGITKIDGKYAWNGDYQFDQVVVTNVERIQFIDKRIYLDTISNDKPYVYSAILDNITRANTLYSHDFSVNFADVDVGDTNTYTATLNDGANLPGWLSITSAGVLSGTPTNNDVAIVNITITSSDAAGLSISDTFALIVNANDAAVITATSDPITEGRTATDITVSGTATHTDTDADNDDNIFQAVTDKTVEYGVYTVTATGKWTYTLDSTNATIDALRAGQSTMDIVTITTEDGTTKDITITINGANDAPTVSLVTLDASTIEDATYSYDTSANFADVDVGDTLAYSAVIDNGDSTASDLPSWLSINSTTGIISGTPGQDDVGSLDITVTATDEEGVNISDTYQLVVQDIVYGTSGNDTLNIIPETKYVYGYKGTDMLVLDGNFSDYTVSQSDSYVSLITNNNTSQVVSLFGIEYLQFDNGLIELIDKNNGNFKLDNIASPWKYSGVSITSPGNDGISAKYLYSVNEFATVWFSELDNDGIYIKGFNQLGNIAIGEMQVDSNSYTEEGSPDITILRDGNYVATWMAYHNDGTYYGIYAQKIDQNGNFIGDETKVNTYDSARQLGHNYPSISALHDGGLIITYTTRGQEDYGEGI